MKLKITRTNDAFALLAENDSGNSFVMDGSAEIGGGNFGMRPMQVLLASLAGCSSIDVISILKKMQQPIESYEVEISGEREKVEEVNLFKSIHLKFILKGKLDKLKVEKAIELSLTKYCSVSKMIDNVANITSSYEIQK